MIRISVPQCVQRDPLGQAGGLDRRPAGSVQDRRIDRMILVPAGKEIGSWSRHFPIGAQDAEQLRRQHHVTVFRALAAPNQDHAAGAIDVGHSQSGDLRRPEPRGIGRGQRRPALQARYGFENLHDFVGAQHDRQLARLARIGDPLWDIRLAERDTDSG